MTPGSRHWFLVGWPPRCPDAVPAARAARRPVAPQARCRQRQKPRTLCADDAGVGGGGGVGGVGGVGVMSCLLLFLFRFICV